ncbi:MAG: DUF4412 domain-containing protein [Chitinophagales bacterium]
MRITLLALVAILMTSLTLDAQGIGQRAKNKAKWKLDNKVDQKIDKALDEGFSALEGMFKKSKNEAENPENSETQNGNPPEVSEESANQIKALSGLFGGLMKPAVYEDKYDFTNTFVMEVEMFKKNGKSEGKNKIKYFLDKTGNHFAVEVIEMGTENGKDSEMPDEVLMIHDYPNQSNISLFVQDGQKKGFATSMEGMSKIMDKSGQKMLEKSVDGKDINYTKTGVTKTINGYKCDQYIMDGEDYYQELWTTTEVGFSNEDVFGKMVNVPQMESIKQSHIQGDMPAGMMIQSEGKDKKTGERTVANMKDFSNQAVNINLSGYEVQNISDMMNGYKGN